MEFTQFKRSQFNDISEFAAKRLPAHPTARYSSFSETWKNTRNRQYVPRPGRLRSENDLFPCCLSCAAQTLTLKEDISEPLWYRRAYVGWLMAEWKWDFGFMLPEELISIFGLGVTPLSKPVERDRVFVHKNDFSRGILDVTLQEHALLKENQHEAKLAVYSNPGFAQVIFEGQIVASENGSIAVAIPRSEVWLDGKEVWKRFVFKSIEMPYNLSNILFHDDSLKVVNDKVFLNGVQL